MPTRAAQKRKRKNRKSTKKKKTIARLKRYASIALVFFISLSFLSGYFLYKRLTLELASAFSSDSVDVTKSDLYSIAYAKVSNFSQDFIKTSEINLILVDKSTSKIISYEIPTDLVIDAPGRYGEEPLYNIMALGKLKTQDDMTESIDLLKRSITKVMGYSVDKYIVVEEAHAAYVDSFFDGTFFIDDLNTLVNIKDSIKTSFSLQEIYDLNSFINSLPSDRIILKPLTQTYIENPIVLDEELMDLTFDSILSREQKSIAVLNGSNISGIANFTARVVKNHGGRVVAIGNSKEVFEESVLIVDDLYSESSLLLQRLFNIDNVILSSDARNYNENEIARSDITIIIGLDEASLL